MLLELVGFKRNRNMVIPSKFLLGFFGAFFFFFLRAENKDNKLKTSFPRRYCFFFEEKLNFNKNSTQ